MTGVDNAPHRRHYETNVAVIASVSEATQWARSTLAQNAPKPLGCFVAALLAMTGVDNAPHRRHCETNFAVIASVSEATQWARPILAQDTPNPTVASALRASQ